MSGRIEILGVPVDLVDLSDVTGIIGQWLDAPPGTLRHIVTVNPEYVIAARRDSRFAETLRGAELALADGIGIVLAARLLRLTVPTRITGNDLVDAAAGIDHPDKRIFLLGAEPGVADAAASVLRDRHPSAAIVGTYSGSPEPEGWQSISDALARSKPSILFVAFGHPRQDLWILVNRARLEAHGILVASGVGGVYDYLSGRVPRAPSLLRRIGLEWLYRLVRQPWRWRRQAALPVFTLLVILEAVRSRTGSGQAS